MTLVALAVFLFAASSLILTACGAALHHQLMGLYERPALPHVRQQSRRPLITRAFLNKVYSPRDLAIQHGPSSIRSRLFEYAQFPSTARVERQILDARSFVEDQFQHLGLNRDLSESQCRTYMELLTTHHHVWNMNATVLMHRLVPMLHYAMRQGYFQDQMGRTLLQEHLINNSLLEGFNALASHRKRISNAHYRLMAQLLHVWTFYYNSQSEHRYIKAIVGKWLSQWIQERRYAKIARFLKELASLSSSTAVQYDYTAMESAQRQLLDMSLDACMCVLAYVDRRWNKTSFKVQMALYKQLLAHGLRIKYSWNWKRRGGLVWVIADLDGKEHYLSVRATRHRPDGQLVKVPLPASFWFAIEDVERQEYSAGRHEHAMDEK